MVVSGVSPSDVFRKHMAKLSDALGTSTNFNRAVDEFFSEELIPLPLVDDVRSTNISAYDKGSKVALELYKQIQSSERPGDVLTVICDVLTRQEDPRIRKIGQSMRC